MAEDWYRAKRLVRTDKLIREALPDTGLFSRGHDPIEEVIRTVPNSVEKFTIDGSWDFSEFQKFYGHLEDIYYIFNRIEKFNAPGTSRKEKADLSHAFLRPYRGGGSYLGLYNNIANDNEAESRLRMSKVKYESPGYARVKTSNSRSMRRLDCCAPFPIHQKKPENFNHLYKLLHGLGLPQPPPNDRASRARTVEIETSARNLSIALGNVSYEAVAALLMAISPSPPR